MARAQCIDLDSWARQGDPEAEKELRLVLQQAPGGASAPDYLTRLTQQLGRWAPRKVTSAPDPGQTETPLDPAVRAYIQQPFELTPDEAATIERAQQAYSNVHGLRARIVLATYSLPIIYVHSESARTLAGTGRLLVHIRDRLEDTQAFIDGVMAPGSLGPGQTGQQWIRKVRLTHATIRARAFAAKAQVQAAPPAMPGAPPPDAPLPGSFSAIQDEMPLDQVELAFVLQTFSWVIVDGLRRLGHPMSQREAADHVASWSIIGRMMGVDTELRPDSVEAARALFLHIRDRALAATVPFAPIQDPDDTWLAGPLLAAAWITMLVQIQRERTPDWLRGWLEAWPALDEALQQVSRVLIRQYCGVKASRRLRITRPPFVHWLICQIAVRVLDPVRLAGEIPPSGANDSSAWM